MADDENKSELIDRYLDNELARAEKEVFEKTLAEDPDLKLEVEAQEAVRELIVHQGERASILKIFEGFHTELTEEAAKADNQIPFPKKETVVKKTDGEVKKVVWRNWSYMAVAASVALTILGVWTVFKDRGETGFNQTEIRSRADNESFRIPFLTWRTIQDKPMLQRKEFMDVTITRKSKYNFHYRFNTILEIYSDTLTEKGQKITLQYDPDTRIYRLWIGKKVYKIEKTDSIKPLL